MTEQSVAEQRQGHRCMIKGHNLLEEQNGENFGDPRSNASRTDITHKRRIIKIRMEVTEDTGRRRKEETTEKE